MLAMKIFKLRIKRVMLENNSIIRYEPRDEQNSHVSNKYLYTNKCDPLWRNESFI